MQYALSLIQQWKCLQWHPGKNPAPKHTLVEVCEGGGGHYPEQTFCDETSAKSEYPRAVPAVSDEREDALEAVSLRNSVQS